MKKVFVIAISFVLSFSLLLTGCASGSTTPQPETADSDSSLDSIPSESETDDSSVMAGSEADAASLGNASDLFKTFFVPYVQSVSILDEEDFKTAVDFGEYEMTYNETKPDDYHIYKIGDGSGETAELVFYPTDISQPVESWDHILYEVAYLSADKSKQVIVEDNYHKATAAYTAYDKNKSPSADRHVYDSSDNPFLTGKGLIDVLSEMVVFMFGDE